MIRRGAWAVYAKTLAVSVAVYAVNLAAEKQLGRVIHDPVLCWAAAFAGVQSIIILSLSVALVALRTYSRLKESLYDQLRPAIRDRVLALAFEDESWSSPVPGHGPGRQVLEESIAQALCSVKAAGRNRVARFAIEHGFAARWAQEASSRAKNVRKRAIFLLGLIAPVAGNEAILSAFDDPHPDVRAEAYRALLAGGERAGVDRVFRRVVAEPLLMRALLADDLKRHAASLLAHTVPRVLGEASEAEAGRCFEILIAWRRALPAFELRPWLSRERAGSFSALVLALLPYVMTDDSVGDYVAEALAGADREVQCAAACAAGRLKLERLLPELEGALGWERRVAVAAAAAMGQMGEAGARALERIVVGRDRQAARVAMEALEHITVGTR